MANESVKKSGLFSRALEGAQKQMKKMRVTPGEVAKNVYKSNSKVEKNMGKLRKKFGDNMTVEQEQLIGNMGEFMADRDEGIEHAAQVFNHQGMDDYTKTKDFISNYLEGTNGGDTKGSLKATNARHYFDKENNGKFRAGVVGGAVALNGGALYLANNNLKKKASNNDNRE